MKKSMLVLLVVLLCCNVHAQNWSPVNLTDKYNYRLDNDPVVTQTVWQKTYSVNGADTVFSLNKTFCDTCVTLTGGPDPCDTCYAQNNIAVFFGNTIIKQSNGFCNFRGPGSKVTELYASLNDSWIFDTINSITAQVIFTGTANVLGNTDSIKTVLLSTGDTVQLSQNYGVTIWPNGYGQNSYYRLAGIQGRNIGVLVPRTADYYNFQQGDMFEYIARSQDCGWTSHIHTLTRKYTITSVQVNGDTTVYHANGLSRDDVTNYQTNWTYYNGVNYDIIVIDSADHLGNHFNREMITDNKRTMGLFCLQPPYQGDASVFPENPQAITRLFTDSLGNESIGMALFNDVPVWDLPFSNGGCYISVPGATDTLSPQNFVYNAVILRKGLGQVEGYYDVHFEGFYYEHLEAYRKGNDTVGVFTPDNLLDGINDPVMISMNVFPNPASDEITVELPLGMTAMLAINDLRGCIVKAFGSVSGQVSLQTGNIADGIYILQVSSPGGNTQQKIIINH